MTGRYKDRDGFLWEHYQGTPTTCSSCEQDGVQSLATISCQELGRAICRDCFYKYVFAKPKRVVDPKFIRKKMIEARERKEDRSFQYMQRNSRKALGRPA